MSWFRILIIATTTAGLWSCGGGGQPQGQIPSGSGTVEPTGDAAEFGTFILGSGQLAAAINQEDLSDYQRHLIEDGQLTFAEYEAAAFAAVDCLDQAGYAVFHVPGELEYDRTQATPGPGLSVRGRYRFDVGAAASERAGLVEATTRCRAEYFDLLDLLWAEHTAPSEHDLQVGRSLIGACLREKGLTVPDNPSQEQLFIRAWPPDGHGQGQPVAEYWDCAKRTADELGLSGFIG